MHVYRNGTASFYTYVILTLAISESQKTINLHWNQQKAKTDKKTPPNVKTIQLYSISSHKFVQILKKDVRADGLNTSNATILKIETDTFGRVRIRHYLSNYYICMNKRGDIYGMKKKGRKMRRCVFREITMDDGQTQFVSDKLYNNKRRYLAFRNGGEPKHFSKVLTKTQKATKFSYRFLSQKTRKKRFVKMYTLGEERTKYDILPFDKRRNKLRHRRDICKRQCSRTKKGNWETLKFFVTSVGRMQHPEYSRCECVEK
ncbi:fibroblast growth factor 8b-like isoform X2 [Xenia sp. Carnegie-2017]|uniref:fibroblast growth factor 8b-like isoform X2 n=1 Tax=Xenia sp. Carnegie-2017 TaxID=2897299 RepID=UPI001F038B6B|nr:fibroblast growth factor 8b-like isoform X2 [Xenia sp. Carnegie-2017]